jgi:phosphatidylinositol 4-phosphatase
MAQSIMRKHRIRHHNYLTTILISLFYVVLFVAGSSTTTSSTTPKFFVTDRTGVTGFGARSQKKSIFHRQSKKRKRIVSAVGSAAANLLVASKNVTANPSSSANQYVWAYRTTDPDVLWLQTRDPSSTSTVVKTLRITTDILGEWQVESSTAPDEAVWVPIEGIYGVYSVPSGILWVLITKSEPVMTAPPLPNGNENWWNIHKVKNLEMVHLGGPNRFLLAPELKEEVRQLYLLRKALKQHSLYFCPPNNDNAVVLDMTKNLQQSIEESSSTTNSNYDKYWWNSTNQRPDPRFFWNQVPSETILERYNNDNSEEVLELLKNVIPVTSAFVGAQSNIKIGSNSTMAYNQVLISRRSRFRAGTRFTKRGADASGAVANYAETEQICLILSGSSNDQVKQIHSHVQIRGSIPLHWSSPTDIKTYRPRIRLGTDPLAQARAMRLHLIEQFAYYAYDDEESRDKKTPKLVFVNLIDKHSDQGRLGRAFDSVLNAVLEVHAVEKNETSTEDKPRFKLSLRRKTKTEIPFAITPNSVEHVWFDFHAEVKGGKWDKLKNLLSSMEPSLVNHRYFSASAPAKKKLTWDVKRRQNAIVRTNCMDCLDRTNVVQSIFGRHMLFQQLASAASTYSSPGAKEAWKKLARKFKKNPLKLPWETGEVAHRLLWADNADAISKLYAGTPALKGDFTRTGKRTRKGALDDGMNSLQRYYLNNFLDAARQEGVDILVGYSNFTNTDHLTILSSDGETTTEDRIFDFRAAARQSILGDVLEGLDENQRRDIKMRLGEVDMTGTTLGRKRNGRKQLDFRWLPGDLQMHLIGQASQVLDGEDKVEGYCSKTALESIDRRSASDDPWWYLSENSDGDDGVGKQYAVDDDSVSPETSNSIRHRRITATHMILALVVGIKAPFHLAMVIVSLVYIAFMPDLLNESANFFSKFF